MPIASKRDESEDEDNKEKHLLMHGYEEKPSTDKMIKTRNRALTGVILWNVLMVAGTWFTGWLYISGVLSGTVFIGYMLGFTVMSNLVTWIITLYIYFWGKQAQASIDDANWRLSKFITDLYYMVDDVKAFKNVAVSFTSDFRAIQPFLSEVVRAYHEDQDNFKNLLANLQRFAKMVDAFDELYGERLEMATKCSKEEQKELIRSIVEGGPNVRR